MVNSSTLLRMELDTGADVILVSEKVCKEQLRAFPLQNTEVRLETYTGELVNLKGEPIVAVTYNDQVTQLPLLVAQLR